MFDKQKLLSLSSPMRAIRVLILLISAVFLQCKKPTPVMENDPAVIAATAINQQIDEAVKAAQEAGDEDEKARLYGRASELLMQKGDIKRGLQMARKGARANPTEKVSLTSIAEYYLASGLHKEAEYQLLEVLGRTPDYGRAHHILANNRYSAGKTKEALKHYEIALKLLPQDIAVYNNYAAALVRLGKPKEALSLLEKAIRVDSGYALSYRNAGIAAEKSGQKPAAKKYYLQYLEKNPNAADAETVKLWAAKL